MLKALTKERMSRWGHGFAYAVMIAFFTITLLVVTSLLYKKYIDPTPVFVSALDKPTNFTYCPSFDMDIHLHMVVNKPITLFVNVVVNDEGGIINIPDTESRVTTLHYPFKATFNQTVSWMIPGLPRGRYVRVVSIRSPIDYANPTYLMVPFEIGECK